MNKRPTSQTIINQYNYYYDSATYKFIETKQLNLQSQRFEMSYVVFGGVYAYISSRLVLLTNYKFCLKKKKDHDKIIEILLKSSNICFFIVCLINKHFFSKIYN